MVDVLYRCTVVDGEVHAICSHATGEESENARKSQYDDQVGIDTNILLSRD